MIALAGGGIAALMWGVSTILAGRAARQIGPSSTLALVGAGGLVLVVPIVVVIGLPDATPRDWALLVIAGFGSALGLRLTYAALARGKVGVVVAITSTEGAIAAVIAVILGEAIGGVAAAGIVIATVGVAAVGAGRHAEDSAFAVRDNRRAALTAGAAAAVFGSSLYVSGDLAGRVGGPWVVLFARVTGLVTMGVPLLLQRQLRRERPALWFALAAGLCESTGFLGFLWGASAGIGIAAVMATQYATIATVLSWLLFRERLSPVQLGGLGAVVMGMALVAVGG